jgi:hypothetical protein
VLKAIERKSGRRGGRPWGPRTLDIDIVDYGGLVRHWRGGHPSFRKAGTRPLILPHPLAHERPFVLKPLLDIAPHWHHPRSQSVRELWRAWRARRGRVLQRQEAALGGNCRRKTVDLREPRARRWPCEAQGDLRGQSPRAVPRRCSSKLDPIFATCAIFFRPAPREAQSLKHFLSREDFLAFRALPPCFTLPAGRMPK